MQAVAAEAADEACRALSQEACALSVALVAFPESVLVGQTIGVTMTVTNTSDNEVTAAAPSIISRGGSGGATLMTGPVPPLANIPARGSQTFVLTFLATDAGSITFRGSAEGAQTGTRRTAGSRQAASNTVMAQLRGAIERFLASWNASANPLAWVKTPEEILRKVRPRP